MSSWSIVATVKAEKELIDFFVNYYINMGVDKIYLYLDDPNDSYIEKAYVNNNKICISICDQAFWSQNYEFKNLEYKGRPDGVEDRQTHNVIHALTLAKTKWLACVDIDELIYSDLNIDLTLASVPDNIFSLRLKPYEAVYLDTPPRHINDVFKTPFFKHRETRRDSHFWDEIYPDGLIHKEGLFGHTSGKCFFRVDEPLKWPGLHNFYPIDSSLKVNFLFNDVILLHFEALTVNNFITKTLKRLDSSFNVKYLDKPSVNRLNALKNIYTENGNSGLEKAYCEMHVLNTIQIQDALKLHLIKEINIKTPIKFQKKLLQTHHRSYVIYNEFSNLCQAVEKDDVCKNGYYPVYIAMDFENNKVDTCYFFYKKGNKTFYLYLDRYGNLTNYPFKKAMFFNFHCLDKLRPYFAISSNDSFFTSTPKGDFKLNANSCDAWEKFSYH